MTYVGKKKRTVSKLACRKPTEGLGEGLLSESASRSSTDAGESNESPPSSSSSLFRKGSIANTISNNNNSSNRNLRPLPPPPQVRRRRSQEWIPEDPPTPQSTSNLRTKSSSSSTPSPAGSGDRRVSFAAGTLSPTVAGMQSHNDKDTSFDFSISDKPRIQPRQVNPSQKQKQSPLRKPWVVSKLDAILTCRSSLSLIETWPALTGQKATPQQIVQTSIQRNLAFHLSRLEPPASETLSGLASHDSTVDLDQFAQGPIPVRLDTLQSLVTPLAFWQRPPR
jgi:hypothetical protein